MPCMDSTLAASRRLAAQGLITKEHVDGLIVASLTYRGQDVARGLSRFEGVKQPIPGLE